MKTTLITPIICSLTMLSLTGCHYFSSAEDVSSEYGTEKVENEEFIVSFSEGGQLVAVNSIKVESEMDGSSTIVSIVDEGAYVKGPTQVQAKAGDTPAKLAIRHKVTEADLRHVNPNLEQAIANNETIILPGDLLVELDPGSLKDKINAQKITVRTAKNSVTKSENDLEIQRLRNEQNIDDAKILLNFAQLDLEKFIESDTRLSRDDYAGQLSNLSNQVSISEGKLKWLKELEEKKFLSRMSLREEEQKVAEYRHKIKMLRGESDAYEKYVFPKFLQDYNSKIKQAELQLTTVEQTATNNMISAKEEVDTQKQKFTLEEEQLVEVKDQMSKSRIYAPSSGLVVYHVGESSRYGGSSGIIEKGATLRKGQDIMHLPDLKKMKVTLKIHESRINQVKGPSDVQSKRGDTVALLAKSYGVTEKALREHNEGEYNDGKYMKKYPTLEEVIASGGIVTIPGLPVQIRLDNISDRAFRGEITYVAPVASQAERWGSDKKVFKCEVSIKDKLPSYIRPGASATCRIFVANVPKVREVNGKIVKTLRVPIQSVVTTVEGHRVCFKMNGKNQPVPVPVETGYYDQTHIQITKGLAMGETILKAPLLYAKELNVGGGLFGYRQINADDFFKDLPETTVAPTTVESQKARENLKKKTGFEVRTVPGASTKAGKSKSGGSRRSSDPPAELNLTAQQKTEWTAAAKRMAEKSADIRARGAWSEMRTLRSGFKADLEKFLTEEQLAKYEEFSSQRPSSGGGGNRPSGGGGRGSGGRFSLMSLDADSDGKISEEEYGKVPDRMRQFMGEFSAIDSDSDGVISEEEAAAALQRIRQRFQGGGGGN